MSNIIMIKHFTITISLKLNWAIPRLPCRILLQCNMYCYIYPTKMMPHEVVQHGLGHAFVPEMPCI